MAKSQTIPSLKPEFFISNRKRLFEKLPDRSIAIIHSGIERVRNPGYLYIFRAHSSFYYLSGLTEPDAILVIEKSGKIQKDILFAHR